MIEEIIGIIVILVIAIFMAFVDNDSESNLPKSEPMKSRVKFAPTAVSRSVDSIDKQMEKKYN